MTAVTLTRSQSEPATSGRKSNAPNTQLPYLDKSWGLNAYASALDQLGIVSITDPRGRIIYVNDEFVRISGYSRQELLGENHRLLKSGEHGPEFYAAMYSTITSGKTWRAPMKNRAKDGSYYWVDALIAPLRSGNGKIAGYLSVRIDITAPVNLHIEIAQQRSTLQAVVDSFPGGLSVYDKDLRMVLCNDRQKHMLDYPETLFQHGMPTFEQVVRFNAERGEYGAGDIEALVSSRVERALKGEPHVVERQRPNGTHLEIRGTPLTGGGLVTTYLDISQRKKYQETIDRLARQDPLTGLPNRLMFQDRMRHGLARVKRGDTLALLCIDLDHFKSVNDTLGHPTGDALLKAVAGRLMSSVREMDTVARLGGDEFAVIQVAPKCSADVEVLARRIVDRLSQPFKIGQNTINIGASIGIAMAPDDATDTERLMQNADLALYRVKSAGRGHFGFFETALQQQLLERTRIADGLREALAKDQFELHYQPVLNATSRRIVGFEALIRWRHPERGLVSAGEFIPIAEECGLIAQIGDWVLAQGCKQAALWPSDIWISVNISAAQIRSSQFVGKVVSASADLKPSQLLIEITESMLMRDKEVASEVMTSLRKLGFRFALDDFGTGFSSLSYLQTFPFDKIKIDRSFMSPAADQARSAKLRRAIVQLGGSLDMTCVAEGVETEDQLRALQQEGCAEVQGYLFSRPVPAAEATALLQRRIL